MFLSSLIKAQGFSLPEAMVALGIGSLVSMGGYVLLQGGENLTRKAARQSEMINSRVLLTKILNNPAICTLNLANKKSGDDLQKLVFSKNSSKENVAFEVNKTLNLGEKTGANELHYLAKMSLLRFLPLSLPSDEEINGSLTSVTHGVLELEMTYGKDVKSSATSDVASSRRYSEIYNVNVQVNSATGKVISCLERSKKIIQDFCEKSLRGASDTDQSICYNINISPAEPDGPSINLKKPKAPGKYSLVSKDGLLVGTTSYVNFGSEINRYAEIFYYTMDFNTYYPDGSIDQVTERNEIYYKASYEKTITGEYSSPLGFNYNYTVKEKRRKILDPNGKKITQGWQPAETTYDEEDGEYWSWQNWSLSNLDQVSGNWVYDIYENTSYNPHPLKGGVPAHNTIMSLFAGASGNIFLKNLFAEKVITKTHYIAGTYAYDSDERLKRDIIRLDRSKGLLSLQGYTYSFSPGAREYGFLANEVKPAFPEAVTKGADGYEKVDYLTLLSPMIEVVKSQESKLLQMKKRLKTLEDIH